MLTENSKSTWDWADMCVSQETQGNIIAFSSGWGDGVYPTYLGYDAENNIAKVVTDFDLIQELE
ncbi:MAG: hypothetical protein NVS2B14_01350 [Chamaesiphon sp.]